MLLMTVLKRILNYLTSIETMNYNLTNRFYWGKVSVFSVILGIMHTSSKNDREGYDESDGRGPLSLSGKVIETTEPDKGSGERDEEGTLMYPVGVKKENSRFQGKWARRWLHCMVGEGMSQWEV